MGAASVTPESRETDVELGRMMGERGEGEPESIETNGPLAEACTPKWLTGDGSANACLDRACS